MTAPSNAKAFARLYELHWDEWPQELQVKARRALLTLQMMEGNSPATINALEQNAPETWAAMMKDLNEFAEAHSRYRIVNSGINSANGLGPHGSVENVPGTVGDSNA